MRKSENEKQLERDVYALKHQVEAKQKQVEEVKLENSALKAKLSSATMWISYLHSCIRKEKDFSVPKQELYSFANGYDLEINYNADTEVFDIRMKKQEE